nr:HAD-IA family hydrolase [Sansalvadorimonas sp. 2012CJ34-2]
MITFDLDDTLWDNGPVIRRAVQEGYEWLFNRCPELLQHHDAASLDAMKNRLREEDPELAHRVSEVRVTGMQRALEGVGYTHQEAREIAEQAFGVFHHWRHQVDLFEGVEEMLKILSSHFSLAVITNGNADVNQLGLGQYFQFTVSAEDLNRSKPDPKVFLKALSLAGVSSKDVIHVGDNLITDVQGAAEVGMKTIWFNPKNQECETAPIQPDVVINSLSELPDAVEKLK